MEKLEIGRETVLPDDDLAREYAFKKEIYLKICPAGEPGNFLIVDPSQPVDLSWAQGAELGEIYIVVAVEMTVIEYAALPEWDGF